MSDKKIVFLIQLPPPTNGVSVMNRILINSPRLKEKYEAIIVPISMNRSMSRLGKFHFGKVFKSIGIFFSLLISLMRHHPQAVYMTVSPFGYAFYRDLFYITLIKLFRIKLILHIHGKGIAKFVENHNFARRIFRFMLKNTYVICLSKLPLEDVKPVDSGLPFVVNNGIDVQSERELTGDPQSRLRVLYLSNLCREKGIMDFIEALSILKKRNIPFIGRIAGAPAAISEEDLLGAIESLDLTEHVSYLGPRYNQDKWALFRQSDVFVFPTFFRNEAFPVSILEAMQFSLAVISTPEGAIPEIIENGVTGYLVRANAPEEIADKLEMLAKDRKLNQSLGKAARKKFEERYTLDHFERNMLQVFDAIL